jgi:hypothetical protein
MGGQEPTPDLNPESLQVISTFMLAQAQEIFISKAIQDKMMDIIVAKLCMQAEDMYAEVLRNIQKESTKVYWDTEWRATVCPTIKEHILVDSLFILTHVNMNLEFRLQGSKPPTLDSPITSKVMFVGRRNKLGSRLRGLIKPMTTSSRPSTGLPFQTSLLTI